MQQEHKSKGRQDKHNLHIYRLRRRWKDTHSHRQHKEQKTVLAIRIMPLTATMRTVYEIRIFLFNSVASCRSSPWDTIGSNERCVIVLCWKPVIEWVVTQRVGSLGGRPFYVVLRSAADMKTPRFRWRWMYAEHSPEMADQNTSFFIKCTIGHYFIIFKVNIVFYQKLCRNMVEADSCRSSKQTMFALYLHHFS